jgi:hypothetical protein
VGGGTNTTFRGFLAFVCHKTSDDFWAARQGATSSRSAAAQGNPGFPMFRPDTNQYETGVEISDEDIDQLRLERHGAHPDWNYTMLP